MQHLAVFAGRRTAQAVSLLLTLVAFPAVAFLEDPLVRIRAVDDFAGLDVGRGYDILTGAPRGDCVERTTTSENLPVGQDNIQFVSKEVTTTEELNKALSVSASAQLKAGLGSGSASANFAKSVDIQEYSLFYVVSASLTSQGVRLRDHTSATSLKKEYRDLLKSNNPDRFRRFRMLCGDGFISELIYGGEFKALVRVNTKSRAERESLSGSVSFSGPGGGGGAEFQNRISKISTGREVNISSFRRGGKGDRIAITAADVATQASELPKAVAAGPVVTKMVITSYLMMNLDIGMADFEDVKSAISTLAVLSSAAAERRNDLDYIGRKSDEFYVQEFDFPKIVNEIKALDNLQAEIGKRAAKCFANVGVCKINDLTLPPPTVLPARK